MGVFKGSQCIYLGFGEPEYQKMGSWAVRGAKWCIFIHIGPLKMCLLGLQWSKMGYWGYFSPQIPYCGHWLALKAKIQPILANFISPLALWVQISQKVHTSQTLPCPITFTYELLFQRSFVCLLALINLQCCAKYQAKIQHSSGDISLLGLY